MSRNNPRFTLPVVPRMYVKSTSTVDRTATALLTFPQKDYQGDFVVPDGGDWTFHRDTDLGRVVNYEHGIPIGRAEKASGDYGVEMQTLNIDGTNYTLPIGTTRFFETAKDCKGLVQGSHNVQTALNLAEQCQRLVADDVLTGVSLEFAPDTRYPKSQIAIGNSPIENRKSYRFEKWVGLGWAHCLMPINNDARTLMPGSFDKAMSLFTGRKLAGKSLCRPILKSLSTLANLSRPASVRGGFTTPKRKSVMADDFEDDTDPTTLGEPDGDEAMDMDAMPESDTATGANKPTPAAIHDILQGIQDLLMRAEDHLNGPAENEKGLKLLNTLKADIEKMQSDLLSDAANLFPDAGFEVPDEVAMGEEEPINDDGELKTKAFRKGYPRRFRKSDFTIKKPIDDGKVLVTKEKLEGLVNQVAKLTNIVARQSR